MTHALIGCVLTCCAACLALIPSPHLQAQSAPASSRNVRSAPDARRFRADSFLIREWLRGGTKEPERFVEPRQLAISGDQLVVLDLGMREVSILNAKTGEPKAIITAQGEGPGEFKRPSHLWSRGDAFGVVDQATARLTLFSSHGVYVSGTPLSDAATLEGACLLRDGRIEVKVAGARDAIRSINANGTVASQHSLPMPRGTRAQDIMVHAADVAGPSANNQCAIIPRYGAVWYTISPGGVPVPHPYIEAGATPVSKPEAKTLEKNWRGEIRTVTEISNLPPIARGAMMIADTLIVQAGATKRFPYLLLDYYQLPSGRYLYSRRLQTVFSALTIAPDGWFYGAVIGDEIAAVLAFTPATQRLAPPPAPTQTKSAVKSVDNPTAMPAAKPAVKPAVTARPQPSITPPAKAARPPSTG